MNDEETYKAAELVHSALINQCPPLISVVKLQMVEALGFLGWEVDENGN